MGWWEKEPLRLVEVCDAVDFNMIPLEKEAKTVKRLGGNFQHFHCMLHAADADDTAGLNDRRFFFETGLAKKKNPDRLKAYLPLAHKRDIRVVWPLRHLPDFQNYTILDRFLSKMAESSC